MARRVALLVLPTMALSLSGCLRQVQAASGGRAPLPLADTAGLPNGRVQSPPVLLNVADVTREMVRRYPVTLRRKGTSGTVLVRARILAEGRVDTGTIEILRTPDPAFRSAALDVVARMLFGPATVDGRPVPVWITIPLYFTPPH